MIVVYLSNQYIRVVEGENSGKRIQANQLYYTVDTNRTILNGAIMDEESLQDLIANLWESNHLSKKDVYLVIDSNEFTVKVFDVPVMKPKQTMDYIKREFTDVERISNPVYSYFMMPNQDKKAKLQRVLSVMCARDFVENYINLFAKIDITVAGVECALGVAIRLAEHLSVLEGQTAIMQFVDDMAMTSLLFVDGSYVYSSRNRLFNDPGTGAYVAEVARTVSNLIQFAKAQELAQSVEKVYVAGLSEELMQIYIDTIAVIDDRMEAHGLDVSPALKPGLTSVSGQAISQYALALGGLLKTDAKAGLVADVKRDPQKEAASKAAKKKIVPIAVLGGLLIISAIGLGVRMMMLSSKLNGLIAYNEDPSIIQTCDDYDRVQAQVSAANTLSQNMSGLQTAVASYPIVDSSVVAVLERCAQGLVTAEVSSYDASTGVLSFTTTADNVELINQFIGKLLQEDVFANVNYTGYVQQTDGQWNVNVYCLMAGRVGAE